MFSGVSRNEKTHKAGEPLLVWVSRNNRCDIVKLFVRMEEKNLFGHWQQLPDMIILMS